MKAKGIQSLENHLAELRKSNAKPFTVSGWIRRCYAGELEKMDITVDVMALNEQDAFTQARKKEYGMYSMSITKQSA